MAEEKVYLIFRIYNKKERIRSDKKSRFYGWTKDKNILKAFISQRTKNKYYSEKTYLDIDEVQIDSYDLDINNQIDFIKLKSVSNNDDFYLFMTLDEAQEAEKKIQRYFRELCYLSNIPGKGDYLGMFIHLEDYYADALDFIGYRPPEISAMFQSADIRDDPGDIEGVEELIDEAYSGNYESPQETFSKKSSLPGLFVLPDIASKIIYSVESFIKVLCEDL